jgi:hypothetical protein
MDYLILVLILFTLILNEMASITKEGMLKQNPNIVKRNGNRTCNDEKIHESFDCFSCNNCNVFLHWVIIPLIVGAIVKNANPQSF